MSVGWSMASGSHQCEASSAYPVNTNSDFVPACPCRLCGGRAQHRDNGGPCPEATQLSFSLFLSCMLPLCWRLGQVPVNECVWVQALNMAAGFPVALCLTRTQTPPIFIAKLPWGSLFLELEPWAGTPPSLMGTSAAEISLKILNYHTWVWGQPVSHLCLSYWPLLYIPSCKSFIQLVFRWFSRMIAIHLCSISYRSLLELLLYHVTIS